MSKQRKKFNFIPLTIILLSSLLLSGIFLLTFPFKKTNDLDILSQESYDSIFVSSYSVENYTADAFKTYRGLNTYVCQYSFKTSSELTLYLETALQSNNIINTVYIGLDSYIFYDENNTDETETNDVFSDLCDYITQYPDVTFEILLPAHDMPYWTSKDENELDQILQSYQYAVSCFEPHANAICFFVGDEEWLIHNPANYDAASTPNALISETLLHYTFCDRTKIINMSNSDTILEDFRIMIQKEQHAPSQYPNLSRKTIIFFGDSILGLQNGSYSVPGVINGLTNAHIYNYAIGGTTAYDSDPTTDTDNSFTDQLNKFLNKADFYTRDNTQFPYEKVEPQDMVFVINYGFNDYLENFSTADYEQTLRAGIARISAAYPEAQIIIMTPYENIYHNGGIASVNEQGLNVQQYADVVIKIAGDMDITLLDIPSNLDINESNNSFYFDGGCHYNENGRYYLAKCIISIINIE